MYFEKEEYSIGKNRVILYVGSIEVIVGLQERFIGIWSALYDTSAIAVTEGETNWQPYTLSRN